MSPRPRLAREGKVSFGSTCGGSGCERRTALHGTRRSAEFGVGAAGGIVPAAALYRAIEQAYIVGEVGVAFRTTGSEF